MLAADRDTLTDKHDITTTRSSPQVIAVDLDGDGDLDLISASHTQDRLVWYENLLVEDGVVATLSPLSTTEPTPNPVAATSPPVDVAGKMQPPHPPRGQGQIRSFDGLNSIIPSMRSSYFRETH